MIEALPSHGAVAATVVGGALLLDAFVGEWPSAAHPVVWMGKAVDVAMRLRPAKLGRVGEFSYGLLLAAAIPSLSAALAFGALRSARAAPLASVVLASVLLKSSFALRALGRAALVVHDALSQGNIEQARQGLRSLCSRDPSQLSAPQLVAATVESVAENASDSFVAPLFYYALFGVPGAIFYRAVNTLDSMVGYRGRFEYLGKVSARLDDLLNWIPARLCAAFLALSGGLRGAPLKRALKIYWRDRRRTESPNAGHPMAMMAGLLGVELAKEGHYRLGDAVQPLTSSHILDAFRIVQYAALFHVAAVVLCVGGLDARLAP